MSEYRALTEQQAVEYARGVPGLFEKDAELVSREIGDGNLNLVFHIIDKKHGKSTIFKQALPHLRVIGESWPLTIDRSRIEAEALKLQDSICPGMVPKVYFNDETLALSMVEDLSYLKIMRFELMKMRKFPLFPEQIGRFLARTLFYTTDWHLDPIKKKELVKKFINPELCKITEDLVLTDPYFDAPTNDISPEILDFIRSEWWKKDALRLEVTRLKEGFMQKAQSLLHGDLHTGSIFIDEKELRVFDTEFSFYGPAGFDIGAVIANLMLNYASWSGRDDVTAAEIADYRAYLLDTIAGVYTHFERSFSEAWDKDARPEFRDVKGYKEAVMREIFEDTMGYAGCKNNRRIIGFAHVADIQSIQDLKRRAAAQMLALSIGEAVIMNRRKLTDIHGLVSLIKDFT
jgi:5-methylthioribose kinase